MENGRDFFSRVIEVGVTPQFRLSAMGGGAFFEHMPCLRWMVLFLRV